jgi:hypothetical protein
MELVDIYFGCRMSSESRDRITTAISKWEPPVSRFQMRDERIRSEHTTDLNQESIGKTTRHKSGSGKSFSYAHRSVKLMR